MEKRKNRFISRYLIFAGIMAHVFLILSILFGARVFLHSGSTLAKASTNVGTKILQDYPSIAPVGNMLVEIGDSWATNHYFWREFNSEYWPTVGPKKGIIYNNLVPSELLANANFVADEKQIIEAVRTAVPGDVIVVRNGNYQINVKRIKLSKHKPSKGLPIYLVAEEIGKVNISLNSREGFYIDQPYWHIVGFNFKGICKTQSWCDHALHIVGNASYFYTAHNEFSDFNAAIKVNGLKDAYPDHGVIEYNHFYFNQPRKVKNSVTPINLDHGNNWRASHNIIRDFAKIGGNKVSYGLFFKGGIVGGEISNNLVICSTGKNTQNSVLVGLSIGGGGMGPPFRRGKVEFEASDILVSNNIVMHCSDVGLYVNKGKNSIIAHNILHNTTGLDLRFPQTSGVIFNNVINGKLRYRDGAKGNTHNNVMVKIDYWTGSNTMNRVYHAPDIGDFRLSDASALKSVIETKQDTLLFQDFCGLEIIEPKVPGAIQEKSRCFGSY
ncbi:hypothetical protein [Vibrio alfacsensis]|uniref:hypothetical protein n=1 Tax=Vibrio alfacsensis TaxID=1074311 RepID=UPI00406802C8